MVNPKKWSTFVAGEMAEWSNAAVLKTVDLHGSGGSNPSLSAKNEKSITDVVLFLFCVARKTSGDRYFCRFFYCKGGLCKFISIDHPCKKSGLSRPMFSLFTSDSHLIYGGCGALYIKYQRCPATAVAVRIPFCGKGVKRSSRRLRSSQSHKKVAASARERARGA